MIFLVGVALFLFSTHQMDKVHSSNVETAYSAIGWLGIFAMGLSGVIKVLQVMP